MIELHWTQAQVDEVSPERRARLLWGLRARRLVAMRDAVAAWPAFDDAAAGRRSSQLLAIDVALFPMEAPGT